MSNATKETVMQQIMELIPGLKYEAVFVPQSKSRNAGEKSPSLNWKVTLTNGRASLTTDYSQGIGHLPGYQKGANGIARKSGDWSKYVETCTETGKYCKLLAYEDTKKTVYDVSSWLLHKDTIPAPEMPDVLYSLVLDSDVLNHPSFESWAGDFGYDPDSRKAEAIYQKCLKLALQLRAMLGDANLEKLREVFQDY